MPTGGPPLQAKCCGSWLRARARVPGVCRLGVSRAAPVGGVHRSSDVSLALRSCVSRPLLSCSSISNTVKSPLPRPAPASRRVD